MDGYLALPRSFWLCGDEIPFEDTPDRSGPASREALQRLNVQELEARGIPYREVRGPNDLRVKTILDHEIRKGALR